LVQKRGGERRDFNGGEGRGGEENILIKFMFGSNEGMRRNVF
jgi:hypothetical protein